MASSPYNDGTACTVILSHQRIIAIDESVSLTKKAPKAKAGPGPHDHTGVTWGPLCCYRDKSVSNKHE